jgi:hypothetical protein
MTPTDKEFAPNLVRNLESANQTVSLELLNMAMQVSSIVICDREYRWRAIFIRIVILLTVDLDMADQVENNSH